MKPRRLPAALWVVATMLVAAPLGAQPAPTPPWPSPTGQPQPEAPPPDPAPSGEEPEPPPEADKSPAEQLFERGLEEMLAGRFAEGCPALAQSYRLDPLPGALFTLAECENKWGKLSAAQTHYRDFVARVQQMDAAQRGRQEQRLEVAREQLRALEPRVPRLTLRLAKGTPPDAVVKLDGDTLVAATLGVAMPLDPGEHRVTVTASGRQPSELVLTLAEGDRQDKTLTAGLDGTPPPPPPPPPPPSNGLHPMQMGALVAGGIGLVGLGVGTVAGLIALGHKSTVDEQCEGSACSPEGLEAVDSGQLAGNISTVGFVVGAVGVAAGVTLWLLAPADAQEQASGWTMQVAEIPPPAGAAVAPTGLLVTVTRRW